MTDTPNTDQPLDLDAIEARVAECADCAVHDDWIEMANEDRLALTAEVRKLREALEHTGRILTSREHSSYRINGAVTTLYKALKGTQP